MHRPCGAFFYYHPLVRCKVCEQTAFSRAESTRVVLDDVPFGWIYAIDDISRVPCDASLDFAPVQVGACNSQGTSGGGYLEPVPRNIPVGADRAGSSMALVVIVVDMPMAVRLR